MIELAADAMGFGFEASGCCCNCIGGDMAGADAGGASGVAPCLSDDDAASSPKKALKTPLCCQAWIKNSCWAGSLTALTSLLPSGCFR